MVLNGQLKRLGYFNLTPLDLFFNLRRERKLFFSEVYHFQGKFFLVKFKVKKLIPAQETVDDLLSCFQYDSFYSKHDQNLLAVP